MTIQEVIKEARQGPRGRKFEISGAGDEGSEFELGLDFNTIIRLKNGLNDYRSLRAEEVLSDKWEFIPVLTDSLDKVLEWLKSGKAVGVNGAYLFPGEYDWFYRRDGRFYPYTSSFKWLLESGSYTLTSYTRKDLTK